MLASPEKKGMKYYTRRMYEYKSTRKGEELLSYKQCESSKNLPDRIFGEF
jgi:hypothetical protein